MKWISVQGTTWPVDVPSNDDGVSVQWMLRYGTPSKAQLLSAASVLLAYAALTDPDITLKAAIEKLRRAREATQQAVDT